MMIISQVVEILINGKEQEHAPVPGLQRRPVRGGGDPPQSRDQQGAQERARL